MQEQENIVILIALGCLIMFILVFVIIMFVAIYQRKMLLKEATIRQMEQDKQISLFRASVEAEEQQKEKIARNLHDEINPLLTVLRMNLGRHRLQAEKNTFKPESLQLDMEMLDKAIEGIRTTCHDLIPSFLLEFGLIKSLESHVRSIQEVNHITTGFHNMTEPKQLESFDKQGQLNIYRMCMEILNNLLKHSQCTHLNMITDSIEDNFVIEFVHNGKGVSNDEMEEYTLKSKGLGLKSLKARALILNTTISYQKEPQTASVKLSIPCKL